MLAATLGLLALLTAGNARAEDANEAIAAARAAIVAKDWPAAEAALDRAEALIGDSPKVVEPARLASLWYFRGLVLQAGGDKKGRAPELWRQALVVDNTLPWDEALAGDGDAFSLFEALRGEVTGRTKSDLGVPEVVGGAKLYLDGKKVRAGDKALAGVHLAQVTCPDSCTYGAWLEGGAPLDWFALCPGGVDTAGAPAAEEEEDWGDMAPEFGAPTETAAKTCAAGRPAGPPPAIVKGGGGQAKAPKEPKDPKEPKEAKAPKESEPREGGALPLALTVSGGGLLLTGVTLNFVWVAPAFGAVEDARANPAGVTASEASALSSRFNLSRGTTLGVGVVGAGLLATGLTLQLSDASAGWRPMVGPGGVGLSGRF
jgi:hypothetical protein